jgi:hypothetical protein
MTISTAGGAGMGVWGGVRVDGSLDGCGLGMFMSRILESLRPRAMGVG